MLFNEIAMDLEQNLESGEHAPLTNDRETALAAIAANNALAAANAAYRAACNAGVYALQNICAF